MLRSLYVNTDDYDVLSGVFMSDWLLVSEIENPLRYNSLYVALANSSRGIILAAGG